MTVENDDEKTSNEMANGEVKKSRDLQPSGNSTLSNDSGIQETPDPPDLSCKTFGSINTDGKCFSCDDASASNTALIYMYFAVRSSMLFVNQQLVIDQDQTLSALVHFILLS